MNLLMCGILTWSNGSGHQELFSLFSACTVMAAMAAMAAHVLRTAVSNPNLEHKNANSPESDQAALLDNV